MEDLLAHVAGLTTLSPVLTQQLHQQIRCTRVPKGQLVEQAGTIYTRTYWVRTGLLRLFYLKQGREVTDLFAAEGQWITSAYSFMQQLPDGYYLQALEDSELYSLTFPQLMGLFEQFPPMERFGRIILAKQVLHQAHRLNASQFASAADRYRAFCSSHQDILPRLPLGMVATYLGITQETLSRIRATF